MHKYRCILPFVNETFHANEKPFFKIKLYIWNFKLFKFLNYGFELIERIRYAITHVVQAWTQQSTCFRANVFQESDTAKFAISQMLILPKFQNGQSSTNQILTIEKLGFYFSESAHYSISCYRFELVELVWRPSPSNVVKLNKYEFCSPRVATCS